MELVSLAVFLAQIYTDLQNGYLQAFLENLFEIPTSIATLTNQEELEILVQRLLEILLIKELKLMSEYIAILA